MVCSHLNFSIQSNPVNTDSEGNTGSDFINRVSIFRRSFLQQKKLLLEQNTKEIKEDIGIIKLKFSNLNKAAIAWKHLKIAHL